MSGLRSWGFGSRLALAAVIVAAGVTAGSTFDVWRVEPFPPGPTPSRQAEAMAAVAGGVAAPMSVVFSAVARDPFRSDRKRAQNRYRLPGERVPPTGAVRGLRPSFTGITLVGTTISDDARLAVLQLPRRSPRLVRVGETFEGLELVSVERRVATLTGPDTTIVLELPGPPGGTGEQPGAPDTTGMARAAPSGGGGSSLPLESLRPTVTPMARRPVARERDRRVALKERSVPPMKSHQLGAQGATAGGH